MALRKAGRLESLVASMTAPYSRQQFVCRFRPFNADLFDENKYDMPNSQVPWNLDYYLALVIDEQSRVHHKIVLLRNTHKIE